MERRKNAKTDGQWNMNDGKGESQTDKRQANETTYKKKIAFPQVFMVEIICEVFLFLPLPVFGWNISLFFLSTCRFKYDVNRS